ncbi:GNAT family N-acetyltransferase [Streptomyces sp. B6B3]|uniref:GNAT family N-acetyltransferase n=1 Tax=Streptomyces sp. B6B3 TaxID=3153570 RepID=UPI00325E6BA3
MMLRQLRDTGADAEAVRSVADAAFAPDAEGARDASDASDVSDAARTGGFLRRVRHLTVTDPLGCWLAEDDAGRPVGAALTSRREGLWGLSLLVVAPDAQGKGVGTELLRRALDYGRGTLRGIICATARPVAARLFRGAGFTLHPTMRMAGAVDPAGLPLPDGPAIEGGARQQDLMDSVDRQVRGGAHGPDHAELLRHYRLVVADDLAGSGYCYLDDRGRVRLLAATSRRIATRLLTSALLSAPAAVTTRLRHLTANQEWAIDVGLAAGLDLTPDGYLCLRAMRPPTPYVPSPTFL